MPYLGGGSERLRCLSPETLFILGLWLRLVYSAQWRGLKSTSLFYLLLTSTFPSVWSMPETWRRSNNNKKKVVYFWVFHSAVLRRVRYQATEMYWTEISVYSLVALHWLYTKRTNWQTSSVHFVRCVLFLNYTVWFQ